MERSRRMKKHKCMCMIFIFSSLRSCSKILLCIVPWQTPCKEHGYTYEWPSGREPRLTKNGKQTSAEPRTSSPWQFQDYHHALPQLHPRHRLRRISLFRWIQEICEVTKGLRETAARSCGELQQGWYSRVAGGLHRELRDRRSTSTRWNFSWLRFGTSHKSGITEAPL